VNTAAAHGSTHLCVMEVLPSTDTKRENSSEFFRFLASRLNLVAGDHVPGLLIHFALQCGSAQLCLRCRAHSDKSNSVPSDRSVTSCADASGMVLVVLMGSTLLWATCEGGSALFLQGHGHSQAHRTLVATLPSDSTDTRREIWSPIFEKPQVPQG